MREIVFDKISISGFLSVGEDQEITLSNQSFTVVKGVNNEGKTQLSNGAGKSSIFEAVFWTLTGETLRGSSEVINEKVKSGCLCSLTLHDDLNTYEIKRSKKHPTLGNACLFYINNELVSDQTKKSETLISQTIPSVSDPEILGSIILLGQGLPFRFSSFSPIKRKELLETIISSSEATKLASDLKNKSVDITSKISGLALNITKTDGLIQGLNSTLDYLNNQRNSLLSSEVIDTKIKELEDKKLLINNDLSDIIKIVDELQEQAVSIQGTLDTENEELHKYQASLSMVNSYLSSFKSGNCPTCGRPYEITEESEKQRESLEVKQSMLNNNIDKIKEKIEQSKTNLQQTRLQSGQKLQEKFSLETQLHDIDRSIAALESNKSNETEIINQITAKEQEITQLKINQQEMKSQSESFNKELECVDYLLRLTSREFKSYLVKEVISFLSDRAMHYSSYLFENKQVEVLLSGNKILITVNGRHYENLSGGERQRTDLIVQFALRDLLMVVSGFSTNLLILDEAFDNMDSVGSKKLIDLILKELSDIDSVFIITHHEELGIPYDHQITIEKGLDGISRVRDVV